MRVRERSYLDKILNEGRFIVLCWFYMSLIFFLVVMQIKHVWLSITFVQSLSDINHFKVFLTGFIFYVWRSEYIRSWSKVSKIMWCFNRILSMFWRSPCLMSTYLNIELLNTTFLWTAWLCLQWTKSNLRLIAGCPEEWIGGDRSANVVLHWGMHWQRRPRWLQCLNVRLLSFFLFCVMCWNS